VQGGYLFFIHVPLYEQVRRLCYWSCNVSVNAIGLLVTDVLDLILIY
jgi:hypothetical protein